MIALIPLLGVAFVVADDASAFIPIPQPITRLDSSRRIGLQKTVITTEINSANNIDDVNVCDRTLGSALEKMRLISQADFSPTSKYNKRRSGLVEVKESSIAGAGLGLFAKKKIKAGTIISFYPAHTMGIYFGKSDSSRSASIDSSGEKHFYNHNESNEKDTDAATDNSYIHYIIGKRPLMGVDVSQTLGADALYIDLDITQEESPCFISHRVNDGATVQTNSQDGVLSYYGESRYAKNCVHVPFGPSPLLATVTTKKVNKGDELFTTYGCSYWLEKLLEESGGNEEETEMTDAINLEAKDVAKDLLTYMQGLSVTDANEANELQAIFDES